MHPLDEHSTATPATHSRGGSSSGGSSGKRHNFCGNLEGKMKKNKVYLKYIYARRRK